MSKSFIRSFAVLSFFITSLAAMASECDIGGLDKVALVRALWKSSVVAEAAKIFTPSLAACVDLPDKDIEDALARGRIDYIKGRLIKACFDGNAFDTSMYNRDNGEGAAKRIVEELKRIKA